MRLSSWICAISLSAMVISKALSITPLTPVPSDYEFEKDLWREKAIEKLWLQRSSKNFTTKLQAFEDPALPNTILLLKDESMSESFSLKHRFAWALFMWALIQGYIKEGTTVIEASSGNTAVSEAFWAQQIGVKFLAVVGNDTAQKKLNRITRFGGNYLITDPGRRVEEAEALVEKNPKTSFFMNQFKNADKAEEYFESGHSHHYETVNVYHEILRQMATSSKVKRLVRDTAEPDYFVQAAGTGGTISSVGRYVRKYMKPTTVVLADTQYSTYYDWVVSGRFGGNDTSGSKVWRGPGQGWALTDYVITK